MSSFSSFQWLDMRTQMIVLLVIISVAVTSVRAQEPQCQADDNTCAMCGLYMAESSIPNSGWGIFAGMPGFPKGERIQPLDLAINVADYGAQMQLKRRLLHIEVPHWLLGEYHWTSIVTQSVWEANHIDSMLPGLGMLANSHTGLFNLNNDGPLLRERTARDDPIAGAATHNHNQSFTSLKDIAPGDELFVEYGDNYFESRVEDYGPLPLSEDFQTVDKLLNQWKSLVGNDIHSSLAQELWEQLVVKAIGPLMPDRLRGALPETHSGAVKALSVGAAAQSLDARRFIEWLQQHGMCLDNLEPRDSKIHGNGAFARRPVLAGQMVAPAPVIQLSRHHLSLLTVDANDEIMWQGHQLLLNYCYGHPSSSLLLFPYSPGVNFINHSPEPNVALRWSDKSHMSRPELLNQTVQQVLEYERAGLMMEFYAIRDIAQGEEIVLDYGKDWQRAWDKHVEQWVNPVHSDDYKSSWDFETNEKIYTLEDDDEYPPSYIQTRCWVKPSGLPGPDEEGWYTWQKTGRNLIDGTLPCRVHSATSVEGEEKTYRIIVEDSESQSETKVKDVPWKAITYTENRYTGNQFLRQAFRHEIRLPDDMLPESWKDLEEDDAEQCGLYVAESSIPNSGLGMYTAKSIRQNERIYSGDVVIQVEDYELNNKLRRWFHEDFDSDDDLWLLDNYYWNAETTFAHTEAEDIQSIVPGLGMLANSHTGLFNSMNRIPETTHDLHRGRDPGAGASTNYHDVHYTAEKDIEAGEELFVKYGDHWFKQRSDLGLIPLSHDFERADSLVKHFWKLVRGDVTSELAQDIWGLVKKITPKNSRFAAALPSDLADVAKVVQNGTAKLSTPNHVRSIEWLEENGSCLDNIRPGISTVRQAGRGAFATRTIKKDQVISPMPVVHIRRQDLLIYGADDDDDPETDIHFEGMQLLLNYCYGHSESSLLLFPYSPVVNYVNHNATSPNARLRWSKLPNHKTDWLERTPDDLCEEDHAGLIIDLVATREIRPNEEIFLDYGSDWDREWKTFEREWHPVEGAEDYVPAAALNERIEWLKTVEELEEEPYPAESVATWCFVGRERTIATPSKTPVFKWEYYPGVYLDMDNMFPCDILERLETVDLDDAFHRKDSIAPLDVRYKVVAHHGEDEDEDEEVFTNVPRHAIRFFDTPYSSDNAYRGTFRHEIYLPDDMVPEAWRDLKDI